jgi:Protein of unknown function (DUF2637)
MSRQPDGWIGWTTTGCVALLAVIAGTVSYLHMHQLVAEHGQPAWVAALTPLSVDGMIVAASTALLADSRCGGRGGLLPWALLVTGSVASLAANVAVAEPTATGRVIAAWPSFALIGSYELLMRQIRCAAGSAGTNNPAGRNRSGAGDAASARPQASASLQRRATPGVTGSRAGGSRELQLQAWEWARANQANDGSLPSGRAIAGQYGRHERWGRLVKQAGLAGAFATDGQAP